MQLMGHEGLFIDEYNLKTFTWGDEKDSSCPLVIV
jgi:hypothetical protein